MGKQRGQSCGAELRAKPRARLCEPWEQARRKLRELRSSAQSKPGARKQTQGNFKWQVKYGAFSVSQSQVERVQQYIRDQASHHSKISFEEEFRSLLKSHGIEFEEKYLWE